MEAPGGIDSAPAGPAASDAMEKSPEAFRTISEVAASMDLPQHVLRFWETRFPQIRPLKRAGGRRYYRPDDVDRLRLIKRLLYEEGYTIKGVQKLFKEQGVQALTGGGFDPRAALVEPGADPLAEAPPAVRRPADFEAPASHGVGAGRADRADLELEVLRGALADLAEALRILRQARVPET